MLKPYHVIKTIIFPFFLVATLATTACSNKGRPKGTDVVSRAYQMIDAQQPNEAIHLLEKSLRDEPQNRDYKAVLASAYAHRAGFKVQKLVPILKKAQDFQRLQGENSAGDPQNLKPLALDAKSLISKAGALHEVFSSIPAIEVQQVPDLSHAIDLLGDLGPEMRPSDAIYRVVLQIILFKHYLVERLLGESPAKTNQELESCRIDSAGFVDSFQILSNLLLSVYADLSIAHPSQTATFERLSSETSNSVSSALKTTNSISTLDKNSLMFLKFTIIKAGFGKVILCH